MALVTVGWKFTLFPTNFSIKWKILLLKKNGNKKALKFTTMLSKKKIEFFLMKLMNSGYFQNVSAHIAQYYFSVYLRTKHSQEIQNLASDILSVRNVKFIIEY